MYTERHYHVHARATSEGHPEICFGDYQFFEMALRIAGRLKADHPKSILVASVISLPDCLYGPDDLYQMQTYCVGRPVLAV